MPFLLPDFCGFMHHLKALKRLILLTSVTDNPVVFDM